MKTMTWRIAPRTLALMGLLTGCSSAPRLSSAAWLSWAPWLSSAPRILVSNRSARELTDVELSGHGFRTSLGRLAPAERRSLRVAPSGESGVRLRFSAGQRLIDSGELGYIEPKGGYELDLTVTPALTVSVSGRIRGY
jgi:hypothetical protein